MPYTGKNITPYYPREKVGVQDTSISNGTETTIITAASGQYLDVVHVHCSNDSDNAVTVEFRDIAAGSVKFHLVAPAASFTDLNFYIPMSQTYEGKAWTADIGDFTNTTIRILAQFVKVD